MTAPSTGSRQHSRSRRREMIATGLRHVVDFQDAAYGHLYLDRLGELLTLDRARGGDAHGFTPDTRDGQVPRPRHGL